MPKKHLIVAGALAMPDNFIFPEIPGRDRRLIIAINIPAALFRIARMMGKNPVTPSLIYVPCETDHNCYHFQQANLADDDCFYLDITGTSERPFWYCDDVELSFAIQATTVINGWLKNYD